MSSILYFLIPIVILSFLIVAYLALKGLNETLNKDLLSFKKKKIAAGAIYEKELDLKEMKSKIDALYSELTQLKEYKADTTDVEALTKVMIFYYLNKIKTKHSDSGKLTLTSEILKSRYRKLALDYDNSSVIKTNQTKTNLSYSNN